MKEDKEDENQQDDPATVDLTQKADEWGYLLSEDFPKSEARDSGGQTGSMQVKAKDGKTYQYKNSITAVSSFKAAKRNLKAGGTDHENFGEVIAAAVSRAIAPGKAPEVFLVYNPDDNRVDVASKYVPDIDSGPLDNYARGAKKQILSGAIKGLEEDAEKDPKLLELRKKRKKELEKQKAKLSEGHVRVSFTSSVTDEHNLGLADSPSMREDVALAVALAALSGNHDVNPGNMIKVKTKGKDGIERDGVVGIDPGHAFLDLLRGGEAFGGGLRNKGNRILDFLNRETISHANPFKREPKLWRDYEGLVPSREMANAFMQVATKSKEMQEGLDKSQQQFVELLKALEEDSKENKEHKKHNDTLREHIKESFNAIVDNIPSTVMKLEAMTPEGTVGFVFSRLAVFYKENQEQMKNTAKLMHLQLDINDLIEAKRQNKATISYGQGPIDIAILEENIKDRYAELEKTQGIGKGEGKGLIWVKDGRKNKALEGTLEEYIKQREDFLDKSESKERKTTSNTLKANIADLVKAHKESHQEIIRDGVRIPVDVFAEDIAARYQRLQGNKTNNEDQQLNIGDFTKELQKAVSKMHLSKNQVESLIAILPPKIQKQVKSDFEKNIFKGKLSSIKESLSKFTQRSSKIQPLSSHSSTPSSLSELESSQTRVSSPSKRSSKSDRFRR